ncbi:hypothetical protein EDB86DRAFT_2825271 [Lactarius hatsudake]|nr:hypothetical protein EDB86DRAFT_2825271 [Lactarius hatsudake]
MPTLPVHSPTSLVPSMVSCALLCAPGYEDHTCGGYTRFCNKIQWNADLEQFHLMPFGGLTDMSDNNEQCALRLNGTLKDASEIPWLNDPDNTEPILAHGPGTPSLNLDSDNSMTASLKGKESAQLVGSCHTIKPTAKAQQASLTRFFLTRTILVNGKESVQMSSINSGNSGPSKQGDSTPTVGKGAQKHTKASVSVDPKKCIKTTMGNQDVKSDTNDDQDFMIGDGEARGSDGGDNTEEEGGYEQM